ncbi:Hdd1-like protein [Operophtera brumata]|uniref:Hdd1-like protein n=1 Tax=Operophtera brumata TaxID=104452 RepID=A0A0L7LK23_OPEBR|nr:Hdd1-like protein [Operophtera brumata]
MTKLVLIFTFALITIAKSNDIKVGFASAQSRRIYSEIKQADPALWKRTDDVVIQAPQNEIISAVYVTDLRDDKDGEAFIESGGVGMKSVTIGLKSPTILRGYKFEVEVYGNDPNLNGNGRYLSKGGYQHCKTVIVGQTSDYNGQVRKVFEKNIEATAIPFIKREEEIYFEYPQGDQRIKGIAIKDLEGGEAEPSINRGGLGFNFVNVKVKSARGSGYKILVEVYA